MTNPIKKTGNILSDLSQKLGSSLELPDSAIPGNCHIVLSSNREATVDGCRGVLQYDDDVIRLNAGSVVVRFVGKDLMIRFIKAEQAFITGQILSVDFTS